ncbi:MAG: hypothetical protein QHH24_01260 [Candidatus Bathyarchaeota archaeon]|nr:hypothetical protein [Candidatus Bathyarchaeota archaeon]
MQEASSDRTRVSPYIWLLVIITVAISLILLLLALQEITSEQKDETLATYLLLAGAVLLGSAAYAMIQTRKRVFRAKIESHPIMTTIECKKCGFKSTREFQRGDYIFKESERCQKCGNPTIIAAIYREVKEKEKKRFTS